MKILNYANHEWIEGQRAEAINREIRRLTFMKGFPFDPAFFKTRKLSEKIEHLISLQTLEHDLEDQAIAARTQMQDARFQVFSLLPLELRLKIWRFTMEPHTHPRIHCVDRKRGHFISNQVISPLLHTCVESRAAYFEALEPTFMFQTYVNLNMDIIYLPFLRAVQVLCFNAPIDHTTILRNHIARKVFSAFLKDKSTHMIRRLALRSHVFLYMPSEEWFSELHQIMRDAMPAWKQTYIVLHDNRDPEDTWVDVDARFRELSSRKKRYRHCNYLRSYTRTLNTHEYYRKDYQSNSEYVLEPMVFYFVSVEEGDKLKLERHNSRRAGDLQDVDE